MRENHVEAYIQKSQSSMIERCRGAIESCPQQRDLDGSNCYRADRILLDGSRIYREAIETNSQKLRWIKIVLNSALKKDLRSRQIAQLLRGIGKLSRSAKTIFQKREKHINECNQACYSTKDPINILSSQKHLSIQKKKSQAFRSKTHTHTTSLTNFIFQK